MYTPNSICSKIEAGEKKIHEYVIDMALILIRANSHGRILNALADIERHANLKITGKPRIVDPQTADKIAKGILKQNLRRKCEIAALIKVLDDTTKSIMHIKKIHSPAHLVIISDEYKEFEEIKQMYNNLSVLKGYYSPK